MTCFAGLSLKNFAVVKHGSVAQSGRALDFYAEIKDFACFAKTQSNPGVAGSNPVGAIQHIAKMLISDLKSDVSWARVLALSILKSLIN